MQNLKLNPARRDYIVEQGRPVGSDRIEEAVYYSLLIPRNEWIYGTPDQGSLVHTLANTNHSASTEQQFATYAEDAISRQLIQKGKASAAIAGNLQVTREGSSNQVEVVAADQQLSSQLSFTSV